MQTIFWVTLIVLCTLAVAGASLYYLDKAAGGRDR